MKNNELSFTDDILKEVSRKKEVSLSVVKEVYTAMVSYINKLAGDDETLSISLPQIGNLYATYDGIHKRRASNITIEKRRCFNEKLDKMESLDLRSRMSGHTGRSRHLSKRIQHMGLYTSHRPWEKIQEIQNNKFHEKSK